VSGDGDYGIPTNLPWGMAFPHGLVPTPPGVRVHPTPIYEFIAGVLIAWYLWRRGERLKEQRASGELLGEYLVLTGAARFLVEFIRINPRSFFGVLTNAQVVSLLSMIAGAILIAWRRKQPADVRPLARKCAG
jgi:phosphatidylglycerol:prolipoprotein diacylglycerol transferase